MAERCKCGNAKLSAEELERLEALAKAATPGPWTFKPCEVESDPIGGDFVSSAAFLTELYKVDCGDYLGLNDADAAYIAAVNPLVLLRLTAQVREAEARWDALKAWRVQQQRDMPDDANGGGSGMLLDLKAEMARLESEPPPAQREGRE